jgi:hypothetical protein
MTKVPVEMKSAKDFYVFLGVGAGEREFLEKHASYRYTQASIPKLRRGGTRTLLVPAGLIGERTKNALAAAKARGVKLGNPNGAPGKQVGNADTVAKIKANATQRAADLRVIVEDIRRSGITSVRGIADELHVRGIRAPRGDTWHPTAVARLLNRLPGRSIHKPPRPTAMITASVLSAFIGVVAVAFECEVAALVFLGLVGVNRRGVPTPIGELNY